MDKLLEIGKIVRPHGIKGAVKVIAYLDGVNFSIFKDVLVGRSLNKGKITKVLPLNKDALSISIDIIPDVDTAEKYRNQSIYIDRGLYPSMNNKVYLSDLIGSRILDENGKEIGELVDYEDYGASTILQIKVGAVSYSLPYVDEIIAYNTSLGALQTTRQKFEDLKV